MLEGICCEYCCFLSDAFGNRVCPYAPGNITYIKLSSPENRAQAQRLLAGDRLVYEAEAAVLIKGYVTVVHEAGDYKETIPFSTIEIVRLPGISEGPLAFATRYFCCRLRPRKNCGNIRSAYSRIVVQIEAGVCDESCGKGVDSTATLFEINGSQRTCGALQACITLFYKRPPIRANVCQYNAIAQERQRVFTDADELTAYGSQGIPSPDDVSFCNVYVNGLLQPPVNYDMQRGNLCFKTEDLPAEGGVVSIYSARLMHRNNSKFNAVTNYFVAVSDGVKTTYTDQDVLPEYGDEGIPDPCEVSFFNLYVNGVLQPAPVYFLKKGSFELTEAPKAGQYIILESVVVQSKG